MHERTNDKPSLPRGAGQHLLIAAGDPSTAELLSTTLELAGYRTHTTPSGTEAVSRLTEHRFDLVVLDLAIPDLDDLGRERRPVAHRPPVLFLTQYDSLGKLLPELGLGEQDYVTKPFRIAEVLARAQVLLRGRKPVRRDGEPSYRDLVLDDPACQALRAGRPLNLTPAEYRLLRYLLVNAHKVLSKEQIGRYVWGDFHGDNAIEQLVSRLRRKVDREGGDPLIHTRRGFGYWLGTPSRQEH
ncbi:response regulator transcription factor [Streptomyces phaeolivaceus]|uniref:Response regulator transcription factor n=1 Tax=Streptomyces phaeolivaceus TaxID=2653200 RepID=A0A5P8KEM0_9ACTN|nr:response regulator transcription factor [Streptomyces phaeolivaceus]QFR01784.1 response regulator transcription factor [Streptomyces phaeolivaceus]